MDTSDTGSASTTRTPPLRHWLLGGLFAALTLTAGICWGSLFMRAATDDGSRISRTDAVHIALSATIGFMSIGAGALWLTVWLADRRSDTVNRRLDELHTLITQTAAAQKTAATEAARSLMWDMYELGADTNPPASVVSVIGRNRNRRTSDHARGS